MSSKKAKGNISGITELYIKWGHRSFIFTLICIAWLVWRVGTKPSRLSYPCSQFALSQIALFFGVTSIPLITIGSKSISYIRRKEYLKVAGIALVVVILAGSFALFKNYQENQLRIAGDRTISKPSSSINPSRQTMGLEAGQSLGFPSVPSTEYAVVSFNHDTSVYYGGIPPYDPEGNPAYDFVWETVEKLRLGSPTNPLDDLIESGDTVLIKPNWVDFGPAVYTRPEVVRPLVDMAIAAGATEIYIGDGGPGVATTETVMDSANYTAMTNILQSRYPGLTIEVVDLNIFNDGWHWINLDIDSSFAGSEYTDYDLGTGSGTLYDHTYYQTPDTQGVNPYGEAMGWYAVNDKVLDADVIINVPKMKTHQEMIATMSVKNFVGCTLSSTFNTTGYLERIAHHHQPKEANYFNNDIFWRAILDMNKIVLYANSDGVLQPGQQRKYITVVDGIQAMEKSQHHVYGGGGIPYDLNVVLAGVDPAAVDAVGCRLMGYNFRVIPSINNIDSDAVYPIGTNHPEKIAVIGDDIGSDFIHVFEHNANWDDYAVDLDITDFNPPIINSVNRVGNNITADISGGVVAHVLYQAGGIEYIEKMSKDGDLYSVVLPGGFTTYRIIAQDEYFNSAQAAPPTMETIAEFEGRYYNAVPAFSNLGFDDDNDLDDGWYQVDSHAGDWKVLFTDATGTSWDDDNWSLPVADFVSCSEGSHIIYFKASDDAGYVTGQSGEWSWQFYKDTTPPSDISDIIVSHNEGTWYNDNTVDVSWTDATDALSGLDGYSVLWDSNSASIPDQVKDIEEGVENITSPELADGDSHYCHISSVDNAGNWQSTVHLGPFYIDTVPPSTVSDLIAGSLTTSSITLNWTSPGDGLAANYDIRYSTSNITPANWDSAISCMGEPVPSPAGSPENFVAGGLSSDTVYYFALQTSDSASNLSELSNITSATTLSSGSPSGGGGGGGGSTGTTSLSEYVTSEGRFLVDATAESADQLVKILIPKDTVGKDGNGGRLRFITIKKQSTTPEAPADCELICFAYDIGPAGATLTPLVNLVFYYKDSQVPAGVAEENLMLATLQDRVWVMLEDSVVDPDKNTITTPISHFSVYTAMAQTAPAKFEVAGLTVTPAEVEAGAPVTINVTVTNIGDLTGSYTVVLMINAEEQTKDVTLKGGENQMISFTVTPDEAGQYTVDISGLSGEFTVKDNEGGVTEVPSEPAEPEPSPMPPSQPVEEPEASVRPEAIEEPAATARMAEEMIPPPEPVAWWLIVAYAVCGVIVVGLAVWLFIRRHNNVR